MDSAAGIGSGGKEGRGGTAGEARLAEGMAALTKKDHSCYCVCVISATGLIDPCKRYLDSILSWSPPISSPVKPRCKGGRGAVWMIGPFPIVTTLL